MPADWLPDPEQKPRFQGSANPLECLFPAPATAAATASTDLPPGPIGSWFAAQSVSFLNPSPAAAFPCDGILPGVIAVTIARQDRGGRIILPAAPGRQFDAVAHIGGELSMPIAPDKPRRSLWRRPLLLVPLGLILVLALGISALVVAPPIALVREQLARMVEDATGREFKVGGAVQLAFYPRPGLLLENVTLAGPPDAAGPELVRATRSAGEIDALALLKG